MGRTWGSQAERCSLSSSFPLLPSHGVQLPGSRLNGKYQQTVSSQILGQVLALAAISTPGHMNAMLLRSGATPALTTTTHAGTETTVFQINEWDGCPGMCHMPCNWETQDYCDMGYDSNNCWLGNYCMNRESGGCPTMPGSGSTDYGTSSGSGFSCFEPYEQACNATEMHCDAGYDSDGCWMGNWCQDKSMGGCPAPMGGSEVASGEDICAHMTWTEECSASQISCDSGYSYEGCWFGNYCIDSVNSWDSCPGVCSTMRNWDTEEWCDMGVDTNGCWMGNWCPPMPPMDCGEGMTNCPGPIDPMGCMMPDFCMP